MTLDPSVYDYIKQEYRHINAYMEDSENNPIPKRLTSLFRFIDRDFHCIRRPTNISRLYSIITSLKREFRKFLLLDNQRLRLLDIKNAQIFLGYFAISDYIQQTAEGCITEDEYPDDLVLLKQLSVSGKFYEYLAHKSGYDIQQKEERRKFKDLFFTYAWYADLKPFNDNHIVAKTFNEHFPNVSAIIKKLKKDNASDFPVQLQNMEAAIMLDTIGKQLMDRNIRFLTIHDAVIVNSEEDSKIVQGVIEDTFQEKYGVCPPIDCEIW